MMLRSRRRLRQRPQSMVTHADAKEAVLLAALVENNFRRKNYCKSVTNAASRGIEQQTAGIGCGMTGTIRGVVLPTDLLSL